MHVIHSNSSFPAMMVNGRRFLSAHVHNTQSNQSAKRVLDKPRENTLKKSAHANIQPSVLYGGFFSIWWKSASSFRTLFMLVFIWKLVNRKAQQNQNQNQNQIEISHRRIVISPRGKRIMSKCIQQLGNSDEVTVKEKKNDGKRENEMKTANEWTMP